MEPSNPYLPDHTPSPRLPKRNRLPLILLAVGLVLIGGIVAVVLIAHDNDSTAADPQPVASATPTDPTAHIAEVKQRLRKGDCIPEFTSDDEFVIVPCDQPNGGKVIAVFKLADGPFPGVEQARATVDTRCKREASNPLVEPMTPTAGMWQLGDRVAACILLNLK